MTEAAVVRQSRDYLDILRCANKLEYKFIHVPRPREGQYLEQRQAHSMAGMADLLIFLPGMLVLHIEFKSDKGKQSQAQKRWQSELEAIGHKYYVVREVERLVEILAEHGIGKYKWSLDGTIVLDPRGTCDPEHE